MPTNNPTNRESYIYDHKQYPGNNHDSREHQTKLHDPSNLPDPQRTNDKTPLIMVEPSYASGSTEVFLFFRHGTTAVLPRLIAEQLRDALIKVCNYEDH